MIACARRRLFSIARALDPSTGVDDLDIYTAVSSGDFLTDAKIAWRDAYKMQMCAAVRPLHEGRKKARA